MPAGGLTVGREASRSVVRNPFLQEGNVELLRVVEGMEEAPGQKAKRAWCSRAERTVTMPPSRDNGGDGEET